MQGAAEERYDSGCAVADQPERAQVDRLKLEGVLAAVAQLVSVKVAGVGRLERVEQMVIDRRGTEWSGVRFAGRRQRGRHRGVAGPEQEIGLDGLGLGERTIGPGVGRAAAMEVDVGCDQGSGGASVWSVGGARRGRPGANTSHR